MSFAHSPQFREFPVCFAVKLEISIIAPAPFHKVENMLKLWQGFPEIDKTGRIDVSSSYIFLNS